MPEANESVTILSSPSDRGNRRHGLNAILYGTKAGRNGISAPYFGVRFPDRHLFGSFASMAAVSLLDHVVDDAIDLIASAPSTEGLVPDLRFLLDVEHVIYTTSISSADPTIRPLVRTTYPAIWLKRYVDKSYESVDPVLKRGYASALPFVWSEIEFVETAAVDMMGDAARHGVGPNGLSIPIVSKTGRRGLFSIASSRTDIHWESFCSSNLNSLMQIAQHLHRRFTIDMFGEPNLHLSAREVECLAWCAQGKEANDVAVILGISPHTARDYLKSARFKLGCSNLPQAVAKAIARGLISAP